MKRLLRSSLTASQKINAAEDDSKLMETLSAVKADFDFIMEGLEKLDRSGAEASNNGLIIAEGLQGALQEVISKIGEQIQ